MNVRLVAVLGVALLLGTLPVPPGVLAQGHVVSAAELHRAAVSAAEAREKNLARVEVFFSSGQARKVLSTAHIPCAQVQKAAAQLSDAELVRLAARTERYQKDFAAGALTNQQLTYIIIALATAVIIIIIVER